PAPPLQCPPAPVPRAPGRARGDFLPRRNHGRSRPPARDPARHGPIAAALRAGRAARAPARPGHRRVTVNGPAPGHTPAPRAGAGPGAPAGGRAARRLIAVLLLAAAGLDLARCGLVMATAWHPAAAAGLIAAGLAAAVA